MAYIVIQGNKGFVSLVEKARVQQADGSSKVQTIRGICGLGVMTKEEYFKYQSWAHSFKDQKERKAMVLSSGRAIETKERAVKAAAADKQVKTTVKKPLKEIKEISIQDNKKTKVLREKEWFKTLTDKEQKEYKERQQKRLIEDQKELQKRFKIMRKGKNVNDKITTYEIDDLTQVQKLEAEIKTLRGDGVSKKQGIIEREKKIRNVLGNKYKSGKDVMRGYKEGSINIVDNGEPIKGV